MIGFNEYLRRGANPDPTASTTAKSKTGVQEAETLLETTGAASLARPAAVALFGKVLHAHHDIQQDRTATKSEKSLSSQSIALAGLLLEVIVILTGDERAAAVRSRAAL